MNGKTRAAFLMAVLTVAAVASAQIGTDAGIVYLHVSATNSRGQFIVGLKAEDFRIAEDKAPQEIVSFSGRDIPTSVAVMLDVHGTMRDALKSAAPSIFMKGSSGPANEVFLVESGATSLNEAVFEGLRNLIRRGTNPIRAFVLLTDRTAPGAASFSKVKDLLKEQDVEFFVISVSELADPSAGQLQDVLRDLAQMSGGRSFFTRLASQVEDICIKIDQDLRNQYVIGYRPTNRVQDGKWRKTAVSVTLTDPRTKKVTPLTIRAKSGYYAPTVAATQPRS